MWKASQVSCNHLFIILRVTIENAGKIERLARYTLLGGVALKRKVIAHNHGLVTAESGNVSAM